MQPRLPMRGLRRFSRPEGSASTPLSYQMQLLAHDPAEAAAEYIGQMTAELASMAKTARLDMLHYLLSMARLEAENYASKEER